MAKKRSNDASNILDAVVQGFGGLDEFIASLVQTAQAAPKGSMQRLRAHLTIFQALLQAGATTDDGRTLEEKRVELRKLADEIGDDLDEDDDDEDDTY